MGWQGEAPKVVYEGSPEEQDLAILNDMKAKGISTPEQATQYAQQNWSDRKPSIPPSGGWEGLAPDNPVEIAKKEASGGAISSGDLPGFWKKEGPVLAGATAGSILGTSVGGPIGGIIGATGGGFLGALGSQQLLGQPIDVKDAALEGGVQGAGQVFGEGVLRTAKSLWPYIGGKGMSLYLQKDLVELGEKFASKVDKYLPAKQKVTQGFFPYQVASERSAAAKWQNIVESSFGGRKPTSYFHFAQEQGAKDFAKETSDIVWQGVQKIPPEQLGKQTLNAYEIAENAKNAVAGKLYADADTIASTISVPKTKTITTQIINPRTNQPMSYQQTIQSKDYIDYAPLKNYLESVKAGRLTGRSEMGDKAIDNLISDIDKVGGWDNYVGAHDLRMRLNATITSLKRTSDVGEKHMLEAKGLLDKTMDESAIKSGSPDLVSAYHRATRFYRGFAQRFHNDFMDEFAKKATTNPSIAVDMFIKADQPELIKTLWKATGGKNSQAAQNVQAAAVEKWLTKAATEKGSEVVSGEGGMLSGKTLFNTLKTIDGNNHNLRQIFPQATVDRLWETAKILNTVQKTPNSGGGGMLVQLLQSGYLMQGVGALGMGIGGYSGAKEGGTFTDVESIVPGMTGAAVLFSPRVIAKMLVHPVYGKWFIEGMKPGRGATYQTVQTTNRLIGAALKYYTEDKKQQQQQQALQQVPGQEIKSRTQGGVK